MAKQQSTQLEEFVDTHAGVTPVAGLKLSHRSLVEPESYLLQLREHGFKLVTMTRGNHLKAAISQLRAQERATQMTGEWNSPWAVRAEEPKPGPASIDIEKAIRLTAIFAKMEASLEKSVESVFEGIALRIEYEELASDPVETIELIFGYLGLVAPETIALRYRKATSDRLSDDICNYAEFEAAVEAAGYSHFLEP